VPQCAGRCLDGAVKVPINDKQVSVSAEIVPVNALMVPIGAKMCQIWTVQGEANEENRVAPGRFSTTNLDFLDIVIQ
jgi:hypothetical protein